MRWIMMLAFLSIASIASYTLAQQPAKPALRGPQLMAGDAEADRKPLGLSAADIHVVITGDIAETTMTLTFRNDTPRVLEGELSFPLPDGATVSGYGLDVNGTLVDGVPVEHTTARVTYEKETRKRVDPGLVEQTLGNNFRTRVYPIPANGKRTIKVQYVSQVTANNYRLPLGWSEPVDECTIKVETVGPASADGRSPAPKVVCWGTIPSAKADPTVLTVSGNHSIAETSLKNVKLDDDLVIALPPQPASALVEKRAKTATFDTLMSGPAADRGDYYFAIHDTPPIRQAIDQLQKRPVHIGIWWDASLSRLGADKTREIAVLKRVLANMAPDGSVDLIAFRNVPDAPVTFDLHDGKSDELFKAIDRLIYDGGTNLGLVECPTHYSNLRNAGPIKHLPANYDYWLLFTDGLGNLGPDLPRKLETRVYPISNDSRSNHALLRRIATDSGGEYFNLQTATDDQAAAAIGHESFRLLGVDFKEGEVADIYPRIGQRVTGPLLLSGKLLVPEAKIKLTYGAAGMIPYTTECTLKQAGATETGLISRFWAQQKVADLSSDAEANSEALLALGKEFNLVTPSTSLIVLETVEQYLTYKIVPPKNFKGVYEQFMARIEQQKTEVAQTKEQRIVQVLAMWETRVKWWEQKFEYPKDLKVTMPPDDGVAGFGGGGRGGGGGGGSDGMLLRADAAVALAAAERDPARTLTPGAPAPRHADDAVLLPGVDGDPSRDAGRDTQNNLTLARINSVNDLVRDASISENRDAFSLGVPRAGSSTEAALSIAVKPWDPDVPYLKAMREAGGDGAYAVYLKQRPAFLASPAFYLDCADFLLRSGQRQMGVRVLTNIAELKLANAQLLRIVAHRLNQIGDRDLAIDLFQKIKKMRPEEPQSWRDLALALSDRADAARSEPSSGPDVTPRAMRDYREALELLNHVVMNQWDRFEEIEVTALMEANRIIAILDTLPHHGEIAIPLDPRLIKNLDCDVRVVLTWDADQTDVDLWVTEPSGEKCFYRHDRTTIGGMISRDFTQGYGPEEYCLRRMMPGEYKIQANYYGSSQISLVGPATVQATFIVNFGRPTEKRQAMTLRLTTQKDVVDVGSVTVGK